MAETTEPLVFKIEARSFINSLTRMGTALANLGNQAAEAANQLEGAFRPIERRAVAVAEAIKKTGEGVEPIAQSYRKLGLAFAKLNKELDEEKALGLATALETLNIAVKETGSLQRFAEKMNKLKGVLKQVKTDAEKAAAAVTALVKAADKEIGVQRQRRQTPEQAKRDQILTQKAEIQLQEALAKQTERTARAAERANKRIGRSAKKASEESVSAYKRIERSVAGLRVRLLNLRTAFGFIGGGFLVKRVLGFAGDFEDELARVNTIIQDQSEVQLPQYKQQLLELSKQGPQDLIDLTQGLYQIISAGIPTIEGAGGAFDVLAASQKAAVAGISTLKEAADATVTTLNGFRTESLSASEATDKLFATVRLGRTRFDLLARSVGRVAAIGDEFGASSDEILGGLAAITRVIPSTNEAVTQLRALITGIVRPTKDATDVLGLLTAKQPQLKDLLSAGGLQRRGLVDTLRQLTAVTGGSSTAITKLFPNVRALAASAILGGRNFKEFERIVAGVADSAGETDKAFKKMRFTFNNVAAVFRNKVATILVKIGDQIMPKLVELFERLGAFLIKNQDKIAKFFVLIADALIAIVNLAQQFSNEILGALAGGLTGKIVSYLAGLVPAISKFLGKKAETIGETTRQSFIESLLVPGGAALGALAGESIFGLRTDVDGQVALDRRQPLVADALALEQGFRTAGLFQEAFTSATQGQGLFIDTPIRVDDIVLGDLKKQLNLSEEIDKAKTFNDVFALLRQSVKKTGNDFGTFRDLIANTSTELALIKEERDRNQNAVSSLSSVFVAEEMREGIQARLASIKDQYLQAADALESRSPDVAAAIREIFTAGDVESLSAGAIDSIEAFQEALGRLGQAMPEIGDQALRLRERFGKFEEFLPGGRLGDQRKLPEFQLENVFKETDPFFDRLQEQRTRILQEIEQAQDRVDSEVRTGLENRIALEEQLNEALAEQEKLRFGRVSKDAVGTNVQKRRADLRTVVDGLREEIAANDVLIAKEKERAKIQEEISRNQLDGIWRTIKEALERAELLRVQTEANKKLAGQASRAAKLRVDEIKDRGLILRIQNQIREAELDIADAQLATARIRLQSAEATAKERLERAQLIGGVREQVKAEKELDRAQSLRLVQEFASLRAREQEIKVSREKLSDDQKLAEVQRVIGNLDKEILQQQVNIANAQDANARNAAASIKKALEELRDSARDLTDDALVPALRDRYIAVLGQLGEQVRNDLERLFSEIQLLDVRAAVRPSAIAEFEQSALRIKIAFEQAAQGVQQTVQATKDTLRQIADTQAQLRIQRRSSTFTGQLAQTLTSEIDVAQFKAARDAIDREIALVGEALTLSVENLRRNAALERKQLLAEREEAQRILSNLNALGISSAEANKQAQLVDELAQKLEILDRVTTATNAQLEREADLKQKGLELSKLQIQQQQNLDKAREEAAKQGGLLANTLSGGILGAAQFVGQIADAFDGDVEAGVVASTKLFERLGEAFAAVNQRLENFLPKFSSVLTTMFDSLLQGPNKVIEGLNTAFSGVFAILFGGLSEAIESILGFDFFREEDQRARDTLPSVDLQGRFFDQRPEERARVLAEVAAQGAARDALTADRLEQDPQLSAADNARQILDRAIGTALAATDVLVEILPELVETFLEKVIDVLPQLAGKLAQAVAAGIRVLADKLDELIIAVLDAIVEALPVLLEAIGEAIPVIIASIIARLPEIVARVLKALGLGVGGLFAGLGKGVASLFHSGGKVRSGQRNRGLAARMHAMGAPAFANGGTVTPMGLTQGMLNRRLQKDEVPAVLQVGERVVSRQELARMGGEAALNQFLANGGAMAGGGNFDGVIQGLSPQAAAAFANAFAQAMRGFMGSGVGYNPNVGARVGRGRAY